MWYTIMICSLENVFQMDPGCFIYIIMLNFNSINLWYCLSWNDGLDHGSDIPWDISTPLKKTEHGRLKFLRGQYNDLITKLPDIDVKRILELLNKSLYWPVNLIRKQVSSECQALESGSIFNESLISNSVKRKYIIL